MEDQLVSRTTVVAAILWGCAAGIMLIAWSVMLLDPGDWRWASMLTGTALATTGVAMTVHIRGYMLRVVALIRALHGLAGECARRELHSIS